MSVVVLRSIVFRAWTCAIALLLASQAVCCLAADEPPRPPNIVFVLADDLGWHDLACYGNQFNESPHIDAFARQGMRFTNAYAACPVCSPTRASIMSGQYQARFGLTDFIPGHARPYEQLRVPENASALPLEIVTMAEALRSAGYATAQFGKWHLGGATHYPGQQGFDEFIVTNGRHFAPFKTEPETDLPDDTPLAEFLTDRALDFIDRHEQQSPDQPFFVYLCHYAVHIPLQGRAEVIERFEAKAKVEGYPSNPIYAALVYELDNAMGRLTAGLDRLGVADDTLVVFFSDNGGLVRSYRGEGDAVTNNLPLRDEKGSLYEGGVRVPCIVRWPGHVAPGSECAAPIISPDFYPTFLAAVGAEPPGQALDGASILPLLAGEAALPRDALYWHYPHYHHSRPAGAIRLGDWKLIEFFDGSGVELYNLADDLGESTNLAQQHPERTAELLRRLHEWQATVHARMPTPNPDYDPVRAAEWDQRPRRN